MNQKYGTTIHGIEVSVMTEDYGTVSLVYRDEEYDRNLKAFLRDGNVMNDSDQLLRIREDIVDEICEYVKSVGFKVV